MKNQFYSDIEPFRVLVRRKYLNPKFDGFEEAYLIGVTALANRPLLFTVHLESGALFSRLPIIALSCTKYGATPTEKEIPINLAQPWSAFDASIQVFTYAHLKDCDVQTKLSGREVFGKYLFTIDYNGHGLAEDPTEYKSHNVCVLEDGNLIAYPNNYLLFTDGFFTEINGWPEYRRSDKYWSDVK